MRRLWLALVLLGALPLPAAHAGMTATRAKWDTRVLALVPRPGFPAHAYVHPNGRIYAGTYDNPAGDTLASRVFEYTGAGTLLRSWTVQGQDLSGPHGIQAATSDARGRLVLLDKSPPRALLLDRGSGRQTTYAAFPAGAVPNYAAWGPDGSLYVTDYAQPTLWRVPPGGGEPEAWLSDPRLDGDEFGTTGLALMADRKTLLVAMQSEAGGAAGNPATGRLWKLPIAAGGEPGPMEQFWESGPLDGPDGFAIARSGAVYVALLPTNQLVQVGADGAELERFPPQPLTGDNGSSVPFDSPSSARFLGTRLIVAQQSFFAGDPAHQAILDVEAGEPGLKELIPRNAGRVDAVRPRITRVRVDGRNVRFRLSERAEVIGTARARRGDASVLKYFGTDRLAAGRHSVRFHLGRGRWRFRLVAIDAAGNHSRALHRKVKVR
jgi:sugar lactone lactonase YvrE